MQTVSNRIWVLLWGDLCKQSRIDCGPRSPHGMIPATHNFGIKQI
jgi:hypothetical protein